MPYHESIIKQSVDDMNIEVKLLRTDVYKGKPFAVRVRDLDANETITMVLCPTRTLAEKHYNIYTRQEQHE